MSHDGLPDDFMLSDTQLREVIERAARAEPRTSGISITMLRQVAAELEIDPTALARALDEVVGLPVRGRPVRSWFRRQATRAGRFLSQFLPREGRLVASLTLGAAFGWLSGNVAKSIMMTVNGMRIATTGTAFLDVPLAIAIVVLTFANSLARRHEGGLRRYLAETFVLWGGFAAVWSLTSGHGLTDDLLRWTLGGLFVASAWGIAIIRPRPWLGSGQARLPVAHRRPPAVEPPADTEVRRSRVRPLASLSGVIVGLR